MDSSAKVPVSHTLWSPNDTVKDTAELLGINLPDDAARNLAMDVEYRIHEILEAAGQFMRHSKRKVLSTLDVAAALRVLNIEPLYGYDNSQQLSFKEALVGAGGQTLYYLHEQEIDFEKLINTELPPVPRHSSFSAHWLAVEGVQPIVPQNPLPSDIKAIPTVLRGATLSVLGQDLLSLAASDMNHPSLSLDAVNSKKSASMSVRPLVKHVLSKELKLYFDRVVQVLVSLDPQKEHLKMAALSSLKSDPGLHQLVPYLVQFVAEQITNHLRSIELLSTMLEVISALADNKTIFLDPYVHALVPCILTLLLAKRIGPAIKDKLKAEYQDALRSQLAVREFAAILLLHVVAVHGLSYTTLRPRVTRTLLRALLDPAKPVGSHFGAVLGLKIMGREVVSLVLVGNIRAWWQLIDNDEKMTPFECKILQNAALDALRVLKVTANQGTDTELTEAKMDIDTDESSQKLTSQEMSRLSVRIGVPLANAVAALHDAKSILSGLFFGEAIQ